MAARATWKGTIKLAALAVPVALYAAATISKRIAFHILNRKTGNRVRREYVDEETEKPVDKDQQVKGYKTGKDQYIILGPDEIAEAVPGSHKTLKIEAFIPCREVETVYFDKPYFIASADETFSDSFAVVREGMRKKNVAALARVVLFRRVRTVMLRARGSASSRIRSTSIARCGRGRRSSTTSPTWRSRARCSTSPSTSSAPRMGEFHPRDFDDRYDTAVAELVKAKIEGREIKAPKPPKETKATSLMDALRESAKASAKTKPPAPSKKKASSSSRKTAEPAKRRKAG